MNVVAVMFDEVFAIEELTELAHTARRWTIRTWSDGPVLLTVFPIKVLCVSCGIVHEISEVAGQLLGRCKVRRVDEGMRREDGGVVGHAQHDRQGGAVISTH